MSFTLTLDGFPPRTVGQDARDHFIRQAIRRQYDVTRVRGGHVVTLPGGRMVAILAAP
ncbi:hypothetical protein ACE1SV_12470 [Streptomyces sennicomposti]